jgi:hypothetical protein
MRNWIFLIITLLIMPLVHAETAAEKGLAIMIEADKRDQGWQDSSVDMLMTLRNRQGEESVRKIRMKNLEVIGDGDKSLTVFDQPRDVKGTAFLTYSHSLVPDDQ